MLKKLLRALAVLVALLVVAIVAARLAWSNPLPAGEPGPAADALAQKMMAAVDTDAWGRTGAVRFTFDLTHIAHLWDKARGLDRVRFGDVEVLVDTTTRKGVATRAGQPVTGAEGEKLVDKAYRVWANDSFWLNPIAKVMDAGTTRERATVDGQEALLVRFATGGATPGDAYLFLLDDKGVPTAWRTWVSVFPLPGNQLSFARWQGLPTGARVSTGHDGHVADINFSDVDARATLQELEPGVDPFAALAPSPTSMPAR